MARYSKKNRAIISGIGVGLASIFAIASHFDLEMDEITQFMVATLTFFVGIVLLAACTVLLFKGLARLLRGKRDD